jgi:hypothetical protein
MYMGCEGGEVTVSRLAVAFVSEDWTTKRTIPGSKLHFLSSAVTFPNFLSQLFLNEIDESQLRVRSFYEAK